ncbi:MAG TPA: hypothetical protein VJ024_09850 [Thermodesulfovibrionales bacterium]|nr:hypothetical protein [Thermodesulfovibrionales bacterium]
MTDDLRDELQEIQIRIAGIISEVKCSEGRKYRIMETKIENVFRLFYVLEVAILLSKCKDKNKDWNHFNHTLFQQELEIVAAQKKKKGTYRYILNLASVLRKEECVEHLKYVLVTGRGGIKQPSRA